MGDGVGFEETGPRLIPLVDAEGDLVTEKGARFGGGPPTVAVVNTNGFEQSVDGGGGDAQQPLMDIRRESSLQRFVAGDPQREDGFQALGAGQIGGEPDGFERLQKRFVVIDGLRSPAFGFALSKAFEGAEKPNRMLAMIPAGGAEFVKNAAFVDSGGAFVSL